MIPSIDSGVDIDVLLRGVAYDLDKLRRYLRVLGVIHGCAALGEKGRGGHGEAAQQHQAQRKAGRMSGSPDSLAHYIFFLHRFAPVGIWRAAVS
jgi:hypothetical protein